MAVPDYESIMLPLLELASAANNDGVKVADAIDQLAVKFKLTDEERTELLPSGGTLKFSSRVSWARAYLQKAGLSLLRKVENRPYQNALSLITL